MKMFQNKVDNSKPQAGGHVMGPCKQSIRRRKDRSITLPTGILSLPPAPFSRPVFCTAPKLTECLKEAKLFTVETEKDRCREVAVMVRRGAI